MGVQMMKIWTFFEKEYQVEDMNPPWRKGEQVDNMELPKKGGVNMKLTSMMDDNDDDKVLHSLVGVVSSLEDGRYNNLFMRAVLTR